MVVKDKSRNKETGQDATEVQEGNNELDLGGNSGNQQKWEDSGCIQEKVSGIYLGNTC